MRRRTTPKFWLFMIVTTLVVFGVSFGVLQHSYNRGRAELERISDYRDDMILKVQDLSNALEYAKTDDFIIRTARDELGLMMPGEVRYVNGSN